MSKRESQKNIEYIEDVEKVFSRLSCQDQLKLEFSKRYVNNLHLFKVEDGDQVQIGPLDDKILEYFIFSILVEFDRFSWSHNFRNHQEQLF